MSNLLLVVIVLFLVFVYIVKRFRKNNEIQKVFTREAVLRINKSDKKLNKTLKYSLNSILLLLLTRALFVSIEKPQERNFFQRNHDKNKRILFLIDVSLSMITDDVTPSRLDRAKLYIEEIMVNSFGYSYALIPFAGSSFLQCPFTDDQEIIKQYLMVLNRSTIGSGGSCFSCGIKTALDFLEKNKKTEQGSDIMVVLTDGSDFCGDDEDLYKALKKLDIKKFIVGIGGKKPVPIVLVGEKYLSARVLKLDEKGNVVLTKGDRENLKKISNFIGADFSLELKGIINYIKSNKAYGDPLIKEPSSDIEEEFFLYVLIPLFILIFNQLITGRSRRKIKWVGRFEN